MHTLTPIGMDSFFIVEDSFRRIQKPYLEFKSEARIINKNPPAFKVDFSRDMDVPAAKANHEDCNKFAQDVLGNSLPMPILVQRPK